MTPTQQRPDGSRLGLSVAFAAITVGVIYGYDTSNIGAALLFIAKDFRLDTAEMGLVTTVAIIGEIGGALGGGALANRIGRKRSMVLVAATFAVFSLLSGLAWSLPALAVSRLLLGVTIGVSIVVAPVFIAESSVASIRGRLLVFYQVATVIGIILGYLVALALSATESWRWILGVAAVPSVLITVVLCRLPDTPRWYVMKGRVSEAREVLIGIGSAGPSSDVESELAEIQAALSEERGGAVREMFRRPYLRAAIFVVGLGFFVQITGINAIVNYSPLIFKAMGFQGNFLLLGLPALIQVLGLISVLTSAMLVERLGRRPVLLTGIATMVVANALLVWVFAGTTNVAGTTAVLGFVGVLLINVGFTFGFGALVWVYAGESFPARLRSLGASAMLTSDLVANAIVVYYFLDLLEKFGGAVAFAVFGVLGLAAFVFVFVFAPETKGRPLEDIRHFWENGGRWPTQLR
ncbi:MAG TPA: sugar porter family MFS transporter [Pseudonocardia sp.]|jgi:SP family galactose:H+ symporter-like MFS transporter|nr:sugar porter family MFS transporter [Pseudonocardia sp.]